MGLSSIGFLSTLGNPGSLLSNISALSAMHQLNKVSEQLALSQLRLATGKQQPRVQDGPSFYVLQNKMRNQVRGKEMAMDNIADARDMLSVGEAGLKQIDEYLSQMRDLVVRGRNGTLTPEQLDDMNRELRSLMRSIDLVVNTTRFNESAPLLDGSLQLAIQVGPNENDVMAIQLGGFSTERLGISIENVNVSDPDAAGEALARIDFAINAVKDQLIEVGDLQRELGSLSDILAASIVAEEAQASRFGDADAVREQTEVTKLQLLQQLATAALAAANVTPAQILGGIIGR